MEAASRLGTVLASKYRLDEELGRGGMGAVYRAFHLRVHKEFAVKLLLPELLEHKAIARRFFLEAQAAGRIGHPGILDVYDVGEDEGGAPFIVMELLRGEPLATLLQRSRLDVAQACWLAEQMLEVLEAAHRAGVVHRDVKPQNVYLTLAPDGSRALKLLDFGIAKFTAQDVSGVTRSGEIIGSPLYMAPEQAKGELDVDARVDVWSVGAVLYEMLTGAPAHTGPTPVAVLARILTEPVLPPSTRDQKVPSVLDPIVTRALTIDRHARFATAKEMREALVAIRSEVGLGAEAPSFPMPASIPPSDRSAVSAFGTTATVEPIAASMVTADTRPPGTRRRPLVIGLALVALGVGAVLPWLVPGWAAAPGAVDAPSAPEDALPVTVPAPLAMSSDASASSPPSASAPAPAPAPSASASALDAAAPPKASSSSGPVVHLPDVSKPACAAGEVLSSGHCCPRGLVWQAGRCERPLATSF